jgi:hypothetical protein
MTLCLIDFFEFQRAHSLLLAARKFNLMQRYKVKPRVERFSPRIGIADSLILDNFFIDEQVGFLSERLFLWKHAKNGTNPRN